MKCKSASALALAVILSTSTVVRANPSADELNKNLSQQKQELQQNEKEYNDIVKKMTETQIKIEKMDESIQDNMDEMKKISSEMETVKSGILDTENQIKVKEKDIENTKEKIGLRAKQTYMGGRDEYIKILFSSRNLHDFFIKLEVLKKMTLYDKNLIVQLQDNKKEIEEKKGELENKKSSLDSLKSKYQYELNKLTAAKKEQSDLVYSLQQQKRQYADKMQQNQSAINTIVKNLDELRRKELESKNQVNLSSNAVLAYASKFLNHPYVWGAEGEIFTAADIAKYKGTSHDLTGMEKYLGMEAFDCSGLTWYVYSHFGVNLPRIASDQQRVGTYVSREDLEPADLVYFGEPAYHVGIYVGNGMFLHAPYSGALVEISPLGFRTDFANGRRVFK